MTAKTDGQLNLRVVLYGAVNSGKSSLINAMAGKTVAKTSSHAGETVATSSHALDGAEYKMALEEFLLILVDTPGLVEAGGSERAKTAFDAVRAADLVLFVLASDATEAEHAAIMQVRDVSKPVLMALTKTDQLTQKQRTQRREAIHKKFARLIGPSNIVEISAAPTRKVEIINAATGKKMIEDRTGIPDVTALQARIIAIAKTEGRALIEISGGMERLDSLAATKARRHKQAESAIDDYSIGTAIGIALNPIPILDLFGGGIGIATLVKRLSAIYETPMAMDEINELASQLLRNSRSELFWVVASIAGGSLLKSVPGLGTAGGALLQAAAAGFLVNVVGHTAKLYMDNGKSWEEGSLRETLRHVIANTDKDGTIAHIKEKVRARLDLGT
ncbi:MAG: DUF697 domain-containing protein [Pseudomonadota bacterium]